MGQFGLARVGQVLRPPDPDVLRRAPDSSLAPALHDPWFSRRRRHDPLERRRHVGENGAVANDAPPDVRRRRAERRVVWNSVIAGSAVIGVQKSVTTTGSEAWQLVESTSPGPIQEQLDRDIVQTLAKSDPGATMPADVSSLEPVARSLLQPGDVLTHLGTGGFASTFKVERSDGSVVALKVVDPEMSEADRVHRELAALKRVNHANVVTYRDWGETPFEGATYRWIEMAYVEGQTLSSLLQGGKQYSTAEATRLLHAIVDGAAAIWAQDTAHRDLTPNNILVTADGKPVIVDLGMARHLHDETITVLPTPGTPGWMSPEQVGVNPTHGDWRSDQFVLGLVGYLLLTGATPYVVRNANEAWLAPAHQTPRSVRAVAPTVPPVIADVIEKMLAQQPHRRYLRPEALLADLELAVAALTESVEIPAPEMGFYLEIGQLKSYALGGFLDELAPKGVIIDARARARMSELCLAATEAKAAAIIDPSTVFARSPLEARPAHYCDLPHGTDERLTGFADDEARRTWVQPIHDLHVQESPDMLIAPYFYAGEGELNWVRESLAMATATKALASTDGASTTTVWTGLSLASTWLTSRGERDRMLAAVTAQQHDALYLLVNTTQPSFAPMGDVDVLRGLRDVIEVMTEARVPVIVGRRASSGLLLLALGAAGWSTGVSANQKNGSAHPEENQQGGGPSLDRIYVPQLLNHINLTSYVQMLSHPAGGGLHPTTPYGQALLNFNPSLDALTTDQRVLLHRHNIAAMKAQVDDLSAAPEHSRLTGMRDTVLEARKLYQQLPLQRPGEDEGFLEAWLQVL